MAKRPDSSIDDLLAEIQPATFGVPSRVDVILGELGDGPLKDAFVTALHDPTKFDGPSVARWITAKGHKVSGDTVSHWRRQRGIRRAR